uniref:Uncharacterized protein n=1 Tax=viral metagenome TaxID=1070528 RepID=A0A6H1ZTU5_9ZZZZ
MKSYKQLYQEAKKNKALKQLTPKYHQWDKEGDCIIGAYINQNPVTSRLGGQQYNQYIFETDEGLVKFSLGRAADSEFAEMFAKGIVYSIRFEGKEKISGGRTVNRFMVEEIGVSDQVGEFGSEPEGDDKQDDQE